MAKAKDGFYFAEKAINLRDLLTQMSVHQRFRRFAFKLSAYREADIQIDKLDRMAKEYSKKFRGADLSSTELAKKQGPHLHRLGQQSKKVDAAMSKLVGQTLIESVKEHLGPVPKRSEISSDCERFVRDYNRRLFTEVQRKRLQLPSGFGR